jgi:hypothetical protein
VAALVSGDSTLTTNAGRTLGLFGMQTFSTCREVFRIDGFFSSTKTGMHGGVEVTIIGEFQVHDRRWLHLQHLNVLHEGGVVLGVLGQRHGGVIAFPVGRLVFVQHLFHFLPPKLINQRAEDSAQLV